MCKYLFIIFAENVEINPFHRKKQGLQRLVIREARDYAITRKNKTIEGKESICRTVLIPSSTLRELSPYRLILSEE